MYPSYLKYFRERDSSSLVNFDYDRNLFEFEQNSALPVLKGRLKSCLNYWHTIGANSFVIDTIKFGYRIPFISTPCQASFSNNQSALNNESFVESAIAELVHTHAVVEVPFIPHVVNPLSVSIQSSGKKRLILDLRHVNHFVWKQKFRCEDWRVSLSYVNKGDYLFSFDLKSGYHHIDIFPDHQTFLGFSWVFSGTVRYFCFASLAFGLSSAPYIFTKCLRPLVKFWRSNGINIRRWVRKRGFTAYGQGKFIVCANILKQCEVCCQLRQITMEPHSGACLVGFKLELSYRYHFYYR